MSKRTIPNPNALSLIMFLGNTSVSAPSVIAANKAVDRSVDNRTNADLMYEEESMARPAHTVFAVAAGTEATSRRVISPTNLLFAALSGIVDELPVASLKQERSHFPDVGDGLAVFLVDEERHLIAHFDVVGFGVRKRQFDVQRASLGAANDCRIVRISPISRPTSWS